MGIFMELQNRLKNSGLLIFCIVLSVYFTFHGISGDRGLMQYFYLQREISEARKIAETYHNEKIRLENKVRLLSNASLDLDMLDERARVVLNYASDDEFVILDED